MRKFGVLTAAAALLLLALAGTASAQSLRDAPAGGNEICDGADGFEGQAGPVEPVRAGFAESGCASGDSGSGEEGGGEEGGDEGGGESDPFCDGLAQFPEEMAPLTGPPNGRGDMAFLRHAKGAFLPHPGAWWQVVAVRGREKAGVETPAFPAVLGSRPHAESLMVRG